VLPDWQNSTDVIYNNGTLLNGAMSETTLGYILVTIVGVCIMTFVRLTAKFVEVISQFTVTFYVTLAPMVMCIILRLILESPVIPESHLCLVLLLVYGFGQSVFIVLLPYCLQYISPMIYSLARPLDIVIMFMLQYTDLHNVLPVKGNWVEIMGGLWVELSAL
jgi:hypothetical protein